MSDAKSFDHLWLCQDENGRIEERQFKTKKEADRYARRIEERLNEKVKPVLVINASVLNDVVDLIKNDSFAIGFQTMGQYRSALVNEIESIMDGFDK